MQLGSSSIRPLRRRRLRARACSYTSRTANIIRVGIIIIIQGLSVKKCLHGLMSDRRLGNSPSRSVFIMLLSVKLVPPVLEHRRKLFTLLNTSSKSR